MYRSVAERLARCVIYAINSARTQLRRAVHLEELHVKTLTPVFVAYDRRDRSFVRLLQKLLEHEGIETWESRESNAADVEYRARIQLAQSLIVVVSEHALDSAWLRAELSAFRSRAREGVMIPILLDATLPARVDAALEGCESINMYEDMLAGFVELFACFSRGFLSDQRRAQRNRRHQPDRRGSMLRRLRVGLWQQFAHATGLGKFDTLDLTHHSSAKLITALEVELAKYELFDAEQRQVDARSALGQALISLENSHANRAIYLIEELASFLYRHFQVRGRDRRDSAARRKDSLALSSSTSEAFATGELLQVLQR